MEKYKKSGMIAALLGILSVINAALDFYKGNWNYAVFDLCSTSVILLLWQCWYVRNKKDAKIPVLYIVLLVLSVVPVLMMVSVHF